MADSREKLSPQRVEVAKEKKPVTRLDSNATTTWATDLIGGQKNPFRSFASTGTSLLAELKDVQGLLKLDEQADREERKERQKSWTNSRTWRPVEETREDFSKSKQQCFLPILSGPEDPSHPQLIAIVREKVETGQILGRRRQRQEVGFRLA